MIVCICRNFGTATVEQVLDDLGDRAKTTDLLDVYNLCATKKGRPQEEREPNCGTCLATLKEQVNAYVSCTPSTTK